MTEGDFWALKTHLADGTAQKAIENLETEAQFKIFSMLKPKLFIDGDQWCCLYGENIQEGVVGFGKTPLQSIIAFNAAWNLEVPKEQPKS